MGDLPPGLVRMLRRLRRGAAARGVAMLPCWPLPRCRLCGAAACRAFPSLGARRRAPILGQGGGGVHCSGPCGTRPWRVFETCVSWLWDDLSDVWAGALVQTNSVRYGLARTASLLAGAAHTRAVMRIITAHLCDSLRRCGRMCRAWVRASASWGGTNATRCSNPLVRTPQHPPSLCVVDYPLFLVI